MKNLFSLALLLVILVFSSCSKEASFLSELDLNPSSSDAQETIILSKAEINTPTTIYQSSANGETTIQLQVISAYHSIGTGEFLVNFSGNYDFTDATPKTFQDIDFEDAMGNGSTLNLEHTSSVGSNGSLQLIFSTTGLSLGGLNVENVQAIIIQDDIIE